MAGILSIAIAEPELELSQTEALRFILDRFNPSARARKIYEKVFANDSVQTRRFAFDRIEDVLETDHDKINRNFERKSVELSSRSLLAALKKAGTEPKNLDFLAASTCTGYLCPGIASRLIETCGLRNDLHFVEIVGMGCGSALPALEQCHHFLEAHPGGTAALVSTEICSSAIFIGDSPDLIISNAIFGDGSAAIVLRNWQPDAIVARAKNFTTLTFPEWREDLRFKTEEGRLRNVLSAAVPEKSGLAARKAVDELFRKSLLNASDVQHWVVHAGGEKILDSIQRSLGLAPDALRFSKEVLKLYGNLSSPSVLYILHRLMESGRAKRGEMGVVLTFGAGFTVQACTIEF